MLKRPGDKGCIKKTKSGEFQPQIYDKELDKQRALGSFETAKEAAAKLAAANDKMKANEPVFAKFTMRNGGKPHQKRGTVSCTYPLHSGPAREPTTLTTVACRAAGAAWRTIARAARGGQGLHGRAEEGEEAHRETC